jgi:hypothetical protein
MNDRNDRPENDGVEWPDELRGVTLSVEDRAYIARCCIACVSSARAAWLEELQTQLAKFAGELEACCMRPMHEAVSRQGEILQAILNGMQDAGDRIRREQSDDDWWKNGGDPFDE